MPLSIAYWVLILVWFVFGGWIFVHSPAEDRRPWIGWSLVIFLLFLIIGLKIFGPMFRG